MERAKKISRKYKQSKGKPMTLAKAPTGIKGLDDVTAGGFPRGRPTLVCGGPGCGKTLLGMEFLLRGARDFNEPGVFVSFEESEEALQVNMASLGFDIKKLSKQKKLIVEHIRVERSEIEETGAYDLEGLFIRLGHAIKSNNAKRIVLDTIEVLFSGLNNTAILRSELRRLFQWLKDQGITAVITAERGDGMLTQHGLEEYVSDCVILLENRVIGQVTTRRLRILKYRGSTHGTNEYPFLIEEDGFSVVPVTSLGLYHIASNERVSSGIKRLDSMLGGKGYFRGSSVLISGTAGTGKSSMAAHFAKAACDRGDRCLYFAFEESPSQIARNMKSIGLDFQKSVDNNLLKISSSRPTEFGLEMHLAKMHKEISMFNPSVVVIDPVTNLISAGVQYDVGLMLIRLVDYLKMKDITALFTSLTHGGNDIESTEVGVSSLMDTWILLEDIQSKGERNRALHILKSRGMPHSNQVREFVLTHKGIELVDVYLGASGVLTGSARIAQEADELMAEYGRRRDIGKKEDTLHRKRSTLQQQMKTLKEELDSEEKDLTELKSEEEMRRMTVEKITEAMSKRRGADVNVDKKAKAVKQRSKK